MNTTSTMIREARESEIADSKSVDIIDGGWQELNADDKVHREEVLNKHFSQALQRFNAGVSLTKIRRHYEKLGAKYSPVTFRKKWEQLTREKNQQS